MSEDAGAPRDPFRSLLSLARRGDVARYRGGSEPAFLVSHPDFVKHILVDNHASYTKGTLINTMFKAGVADGLLTSEGAEWKRQRRLMQPAFHRERVAAFGDGMTRATLTALDRWEGFERRGAPLDVAEEMGFLTLAITAEALFGADITAQSETLGRDIAVGLKSIVAPQKPEFQVRKKRLEDAVLRMVEERRSAGSPSRDLLSTLLEARDEETGEGLTDAQLRDQIITLLLAGHETTANALTWTWYLLARDPSAMDTVHREVRSVVDRRVPTVADLPALRFTRMVIDESLRLYPPAWVLGRKASADDALGDFTIPAGGVVALCPYTLHRDPRFWEAPDQFEPRRFTQEQSSRRKPFAYFPFGGGPRLCIGHSFALIEAQLIVATVAQRYGFRLEPGHQVVPERLFVLRPRGGLPMLLHRLAP